MAIDFPSSPSNGTTYTYNGVTYVYNSTTDQWIVQGTGSSELYVLKTGDSMSGKLTGTTADFSGNVKTKDLTSADATVDTLTSNGLVTAPFVTTATTETGGSASSGSGKVVGYQQGTWTPTTSLGAAETIAGATWERIGNQVKAQARLSSFNNSSASAIEISGLPYAATDALGPVMASKFDNPPNACFVDSNSKITFYKNGADKNNGWTQLQYSNKLDANSMIWFSVTYRTNNTDWKPINGATLT